MEYEFGTFTLDTSRLQLLENGVPLALEPQVFALLRLLIENHDRVVMRDEILEVIWKNRSVSDAALSSRMKVARAAIGDDGSRQEMIRTVHGKGFHFVASVRVSDAGRNSGPMQARAPTRPSVAVMPIEMLAPDPEQRLFGEGLSDDIATALGRIGSLRVVLNRDGADPRRISTDLGVRYLLSARMRFSGAAYRLNASLLDASRMEEVWADQFSGRIEDAFEAQDQITTAVLGVLVPNIVMLEVRRAAEQDTQDTKDTYHDVLRAIPLCWTTSSDDNQKALQYLKSALSKNSDYALAHALTSWCRAQEIVYVWSKDPIASKDAVVHHARQALRSAPNDSMVLTFVAHAESLARDQVSAEHHLKTALDLDPNSAWAWSRMGFVHVFLGRLEEAHNAFQKSLSLSPLDPMRHSVYFGLGAAYFFEGDYEASLRWFDQALIENPDMIWAYRAIAASAAEIGDMDRARHAVEIVKSYLPEATAESLSKAIPVALPEYRDQLFASYKKAGF